MPTHSRINGVTLNVARVQINCDLVKTRNYFLRIAPETCQECITLFTFKTESRRIGINNVVQLFSKPDWHECPDFYYDCIESTITVNGTCSLHVSVSDNIPRKLIDYNLIANW